MLASFVLAAAATAVLIMPSPSDSAATQSTTTSFGPLTAADRDLLIKVRQAGLWEMPAGDYAQTRAESQRVKQVARQIKDEHGKLDLLVRQSAKKLGVALPDEPNADQQSWLAQMASESGPAFDKDYVNLLRAAHGKVFSAIALVRAGTRNAEVRKLASDANAFVMRHMTYLESTGLVDHSQLPEPPTPSPAPPVALAGDMRRQQ